MAEEAINLYHHMVCSFKQNSSMSDDYFKYCCTRLEHQIRRKIMLILDKLDRFICRHRRAIGCGISKTDVQGMHALNSEDKAKLIELIEIRDRLNRNPSLEYMIPLARQFMAEMIAANI